MDSVAENKAKFESLRAAHPEFTYKEYAWKREGKALVLSFTYALSPKDTITTTLSISLPEGVTDEAIQAHEDHIFRIGLIEALSYWKAYCSPKFRIACGALWSEEISWWKDTFYDGLGEFRYKNDLLDVTKEEWVEFIYEKKTGEKTSPKNSKLEGNLIAFTGGKDSTLVLGLLRDSGTEPNETFFVSNAEGEREKIKKVLHVADYPETMIDRHMHQRLIALNKEGALNGHTPFSIVVGFIGLLVASLRSRKYVIVGNEASSNEPTVSGTDINHQYSKSLAFEKRFSDYAKMLWPDGPVYFSLLRPLSEIAVGSMLKKYEEALPYISSCNVRAKNGAWCGTCPKCLFAFMLFSAVFDIPFATKMIGLNMFLDENNLEMLRDLTGINPVKPFECVGTIEESRALLAEIYRKDSKAMHEALLADFWGMHDDVLPEPESFHELACEFHEHLIPEKAFVELLKDVQKETCNG